MATSHLVYINYLLAVLWVHLAEWLHKSIRNDNVVFCAEELGSLVPRIGEIYTDAVRVCLKGLNRDNGRSFQETFFDKIVKKMDLCIA